MKKLIALSLTILLSACATPQKQEAAPDKDKMVSEMVGQVLLQKVEENGEHLLCDQPAYTKCFQITTAQCLKETAPFKKKCVDAARQKAGTDLSVNANARDFGGAFAMCMGMNHMFVHQEKAKEIGACMKTAEFDSESAKKSLLNP